MNAVGFTFVCSHKPFLYLYCVILARFFLMRNVVGFFGYFVKIQLIFRLFKILGHISRVPPYQNKEIFPYQHSMSADNCISRYCLHLRSILILQIFVCGNTKKTLIWSALIENKRHFTNIILRFSNQSQPPWGQLKVTSFHNHTCPCAYWFRCRAFWESVLNFDLINNNNPSY
jgi:hypothetical protein